MGVYIFESVQVHIHLNKWTESQDFQALGELKFSKHPLWGCTKHFQVISSLICFLFLSFFIINFSDDICLLTISLKKQLYSICSLFSPKFSHFNTSSPDSIFLWHPSHFLGFYVQCLTSCFVKHFWHLYVPVPIR